MECGILKRNILGDDVNSPVDIDRRNPEKLSKAAGIKIRTSESIASRMVTGKTVNARIARNMMCGHDTVSDFIFFDTPVHLDNLARYLVPQDQRSSFNTIPFQDIASADTTRFHTH
jgi:hypothetical protein